MQQVTVPLPRDRATESPPFETVGVDCAGPLYVKSKGEKRRKAHIALFTCAVTRAVHLELVSDLSTEKFLLAFKRFIARQGLCRVIYSDNARTFKRADQDHRALWEAIKEPELLKYFSKRGITWKYIAERAAWWWKNLNLRCQLTSLSGSAYPLCHLSPFMMRNKPSIPAEKS